MKRILLDRCSLSMKQALGKAGLLLCRAAAMTAMTAKSRMIGRVARQPVGLQGTTMVQPVMGRVKTRGMPVRCLRDMQRLIVWWHRSARLLLMHNGLLLVGSAKSNDEMIALAAVLQKVRRGFRVVGLPVG